MENNYDACPCCKARAYKDLDFCTKCNFPLNGTEKERAQFIGRHVQSKGKVRDTKDATKKAAIVLWIVGGINLLVGFFSFSSDTALAVSGVIVGSIFVIFGLLARKSNTPFLFILIPTIILLASWILPAFINDNPSYLIRGLVFKVLIITPLITALYKSSESGKPHK